MQRLFFMLLMGAIFSAEIAAQNTHVVLNLDDAGAGSLRHAIMNAAPGDEVVLDESLLGQSIGLTSGALFY